MEGVEAVRAGRSCAPPVAAPGSGRAFRQMLDPRLRARQSVVVRGAALRRKVMLTSLLAILLVDRHRLGRMSVVVDARLALLLAIRPRPKYQLLAKLN